MGQNSLFMYCLTLFMYCSDTVHALFMGPTVTLFRKKYIKNGSHGTINTFKNENFVSLILIILDHLFCDGFLLLISTHDCHNIA